MSEDGICVYMVVGGDSCPPYSEDLYYSFPCDAEGACAEELYIEPDETCPSGAHFVLVQNRCNWASTASVTDSATSAESAESAASVPSPALWPRGGVAPEGDRLSGGELASRLRLANAALDALVARAATDDELFLREVRELASHPAGYARWRAGVLLGRWNRWAEARGLGEAARRAQVEAHRIGEPIASLFAAEARAVQPDDADRSLSGMRTLTAEHQQALKPFSP